MEERRSNFTAAMDRDRDRAPVLMDPALMTSSLTAPFKTKPQGSATELLSAGARHSRSRCCLPAAVVPSRRIRRQSFRTRLRVRPELLLALASGQNTREWQGLPPPS